jgi:hypothetical protein
METKIWVRQVRVDPKTGHITVRLQSETTNGSAHWYGPKRDYGASADTFRGRFGGDIDQLKTYLAGQHRAIMGVHVSLVEELTKLEGEVIG